MNKFRHYFSLVMQKSAADLLTEARRGYLGVLWWIIEPIIYMSVFYLIFVVVFDRGGEDRVGFLLTGLVVWKWFSAAILQSSNSISANVGLIRQVYIPKIVFPSMAIMSATMKFFIVFILLVGFLVLSGKTPSISWLSIPLLISIQWLLMLSIGCILSVLVPFLPDMKLIIENGLILMFFLSGVFFDISVASPEVKTFLYLNPMVGIIESYRNVMLNGVWPDWIFLSVVVVSSLLALLVGVYMLVRYDRQFAKVL
ncbi:MAG: ABC transporter permease [Gammaproteobacteria bacterium]|nr:ABC transporter permease [Gammaproteobacteria bacterium]